MTLYETACIGLVIRYLYIFFTIEFMEYSLNVIAFLMFMMFSFFIIASWFLILLNLTIEDSNFSFND